jgi:hypothetical protein
MGVGGSAPHPSCLYPQERPGTHCTGGWEGAENLAPTGIQSPDHSAHSQLLYRLCYLAHTANYIYIYCLTTWSRNSPPSTELKVPPSVCTSQLMNCTKSQFNPVYLFAPHCSVISVLSSYLLLCPANEFFFPLS